jgi:signal transduction histidine kinase
MVRDEFALLRAQAERRGLDVNGASEPDDAENGIVYNLTPDAADDLRRVVATLSDNAVKYADDGGDVTWSVAEEKGTVTIEITNTGPGIAPEDLPHIFERFYRSDKARTAGEGGYGLGLSIAQAICKGRGWTVSAESDPEKITSFRITLPPRSL